MKFIDTTKLSSISGDEYRGKKPYPWHVFRHLITKEGFNELEKNLPDISLFTKTFNIERGYGQKPHNRYELKYEKSLGVSKEWNSFIRELGEGEYRTQVERLFGTRNFNMRFQWQYSVNGCSVSPHCDSKNKLGSHIFYFNADDNWEEEWGGETIILDDKEKFNCDSAPDISDFPEKILVPYRENYSLLFTRTNHSWHAVEPLLCPENVVRKIFTVVFEKEKTSLEKIKEKLLNLLK